MRPSVLDLFSCVGCHALGLSYAGSFTTTAFCEINEWRQRHLSRRFPGSPIHGDIHTFKPPISDICFGGPPCQETSVAAAIHAKRSGSSLWAEMLRCGLEAQCEWIVVEQPPGNAAWEAQVIDDLSNAGFHTGRLSFAASDVGAPYIRRRVYLLACTSLPRLEVAWLTIPSAIDGAKRAAIARGDWDASTIPAFGVDTWRAEDVHDRRERIEALGDSNPPAMAEVIGRILMAGVNA